MAPPTARMIAGVLAGAVVLASAALGQRVISAKSGFVFYVQGRVSIAGGRLKTGDSYRQLQAGERLSTERGRAEVLLNPGMVLRLGDMSSLRMDDVKLTDACVSLESGSAVVTVNYILKTDRIRLLAGGNVIVIKQPGVYRLDVAKVDVAKVDVAQVDAAQTRLRVFSGRAEVRRDGSAAMITVKRGHALSLDEGLKLARFDIKETDALERWAAARSRTNIRRGPQPRPPARYDAQNADPGAHP